MPGEFWKRLSRWLNEPLSPEKSDVPQSRSPGMSKAPQGRSPGMSGTPTADPPGSSAPPQGRSPGEGFTPPPPSTSPKKGGKVLWWVLILGVCGILCLALCDCTPPVGTPAAEPGTQPEIEPLTEQLAAVVTAISGDPEAVVALTLEQQEETVYASDSKQTSSGSETQTVLCEDAAGHDSGLVRTVFAARVAGVAVVCRGGDDPTVRLRVTEAVCAALHLPSDRVYVTAPV